MSERDVGEFVYRGTTLGWPGLPVVAELRLCSASSDPVVATLFAIGCRNRGGAAVVHLVRATDVPLARDAENWLAELEAEVVIERTAGEVEVLATATVAADDAITALGRLGVELPARIASFDNALSETLREHRRLTAAERRSFDDHLKERYDF